MLSNIRSVLSRLVQSTFPPTNKSSRKIAGKTMAMARGYLPLKIAIGAITALVIRSL